MLCHPKDSALCLSRPTVGRSGFLCEILPIEALPGMLNDGVRHTNVFMGLVGAGDHQFERSSISSQVGPTLSLLIFFPPFTWFEVIPFPALLPTATSAPLSLSL